MKTDKRKLFSVLDVFIILIVVVSSVVALLSQFNRTDEQLVCVIRHNGEVVHTVSLDSVASSQEYIIKGKYEVKVVVRSDGVYVHSSCPDKLCEHTGKISTSGRSIVCLPSKVSVSLECDDSKVDVVVG